MSGNVLIVVSGLPASGKTTIGGALSQQLEMPLLDKDEILETLFDSLGCDDLDERYRLSRASDEILYRLAASSPAAVLVNWWNHASAPARLLGICDSIVEVFCDCPIEVAAARFAGRERHPGHLDRLRTPADHEAGIARMRESFPGPLRLGGALIRVDTNQPVDVDALGAEVRSAASTAPAHLPIVTRRATEADAHAMTNVEVSAHDLLRSQGVDFSAIEVSEGVEEPTDWSLAFVAEIGGQVVGMARLTALTRDVVCLDQVSTTAGFAGRGVGRRLLAEIASACREMGYSTITGTTFRDVAFNAPFYQRLGCVEDDDPHPAMVRRRHVEQALGLDQFGPRLIMRWDLSSSQ